MNLPSLGGVFWILGIVAGVVGWGVITGITWLFNNVTIAIGT